MNPHPGIPLELLISELRTFYPDDHATHRMLKELDHDVAKGKLRTKTLKAMRSAQTHYGERSAVTRLLRRAIAQFEANAH